MMGIIGKKVGMTRLYNERGAVTPVTVIQAGPCAVVQVKQSATDGYAAVQLGFDPEPKRRTNRPMAGHFERAGVAPHRVLREFRIEDSSAYPVGSSVDVSLFEVGEKVDVVGVSKGRGFAGPMKRHHSSRGPETHGSMYHRRVGSMGASADPSRVRKGKPGAGRMGAERVTVQNLRVVKVDPERHLIVLKGATPGFNNGYVTIAKSVKAKKKAAS